MELFAKIVNRWKPLTVNYFQKKLQSDVWQGQGMISSWLGRYTDFGDA